MSWLNVVDFFALFMVPITIIMLLMVWFYHAKKHDNILTLPDGYQPIIGHSHYFYQQIFVNNNEHDWMHNILNNSHKHSKLLCLTFPFNTKHILINDMKIIEYLFDRKEKDLFITKNQFDCYKDLLGISIINANGAPHKVHKTKSIKFFEDNNNKTTWNKHFDATSKLMINKMNDNAYHNINELLLRSCLASFCLIYIGTDLNLLQSYPNHNPFLNAFNQTLYYANRRFYKSYWKGLKYFSLGTENIIKNGIILMDSILAIVCESKKSKINTTQCINQRLKERKRTNKLKKHASKTQQKYINKNDGNMNVQKENESSGMESIEFIELAQDNLIDFYLMNDDTIELQELRDNVMNFLYASRDHLALLMSWFFYEITLVENKSVYNKLIAEILGVDKQNKYNIKKLKYLENCLFETLRLHPVKPWIIRQCMANINIKTCDNIIKKNDYIAIHNYSIGRSERIWNQAMRFKPERFEDLKKKNNDFISTFFGINTRCCMGKQLAINAAKIYIFNVLKDYDVIPKQNQKVKYAPSTVLHMKHGFYVKLVKR